MSEESEADETEEIEEEAKVEEEKKVKPKKAKAEKKKKKEKGAFSYYKISEESVTRLRLFCERCGPGYFMADHGNRYACGHCGFTRYKQNQE